MGASETAVPRHNFRMQYGKREIVCVKAISSEHWHRSWDENTSQATDPVEMPTCERRGDRMDCSKENEGGCGQ
jgi:hypothetical protein